MPRDMQPYADVMLLAVKSAQAPVLERLASLEQVNRELQARVNELIGMRDRLTVVETKAAQPLPEVPEVNLSPVLERVAGVEARLSTLGDLRDRVVTIETKSVQPLQVPEPVPVPSVDLSPVLER